METHEAITASLEELRDIIALHMEYLDVMHPEMQAALYDADMEGMAEIIRRLDDFAEIKPCK